MLQGYWFPLLRAFSIDVTGLQLLNQWDLVHLFSIAFRYYFTYFAILLVVIMLRLLMRRRAV